MQPNGSTVTLLIVTSTNDLKILISGTKFFLLGVRGRDVTSYVFVITARCSVWEQTWSVCGATGEICVEKRCANSEWLAVLVHFVKAFRNCNVALHFAIPPLFCGSISRWIDRICHPVSCWQWRQLPWRGRLRVLVFWKTRRNPSNCTYWGEMTPSKCSTP